MIVGDSNIAGSSLSQEELLSEILEKNLGQSVYPLASERLRAVFQHNLLKKTFLKLSFWRVLNGISLMGSHRSSPETSSLPPDLTGLLRLYASILSSNKSQL